jgi:Zn-dependent M28 family amino/carboxypeptidase
MIILPCALLGLLAACERGGAGSSSTTPFDGETARGYVKTQLDFGPRVPGTEAARKAGDWIVEQMRSRADTVIEQRWTHVTQAGDTLPLRNILARYKPQATDRVIYITHWDSRPTSDEESDPAKRKLPVPGANDGASGVALFIALGDALRKTPPDVGLDLLFVDGEDYGPSFDAGKDQDVLIGSRYFVDHLPTPTYQPLYGVLWDMIGDESLQIYEEENSLRAAPEVVKRVWDTALALGYDRYFIPESKYEITDDHIPFIKRGMRVIDVIDLDYPAPGMRSYHHTQDDTLDKVSARSLKIVGDVALRLVSGGAQ